MVVPAQEIGTPSSTKIAIDNLGVSRHIVDAGRPLLKGAAITPFTPRRPAPRLSRTTYVRRSPTLRGVPSRLLHAMAVEETVTLLGLDIHKALASPCRGSVNMEALMLPELETPRTLTPAVQVGPACFTPL